MRKPKGYCCSPEDPMDCAERAACEDAGTAGHYSCGVCPAHRRPRHTCGCSSMPTPTLAAPANLTDAELTRAWEELETLLGGKV